MKARRSWGGAISLSATQQAEFELDVFGKRGLTLVRGEGATLWDDEAREYLDAMSAHGAAILGHAHPRVLEALTRQASQLMSCPGSFAHPERAKLMERLARRAPKSIERVFLCNSGTEAVEAALKFARASTGRSGVVAAKRGFHGRTFGAMSTTFNPKQHARFAPVLPGVEFVAFNDAAGLEGALGADVGALVLEVVQGEGGVYVADEAFLETAQRLCGERGVLLVVDEVQTGFGRTGRFFACEHYALEPDIVCLAKGIAAGFPMGAVLVSERVDIAVGEHGTTFGGNPLACAVANAVLDCLEAPGFLDAVAAKGRRFLEQLREIHSSRIADVRGLGLMAGLQLNERARPFLSQLAEDGVLALSAGPKVLRFLPPLVASETELTRLAQATERALLSP